MNPKIASAVASSGYVPIRNANEVRSEAMWLDQEILQYKRWLEIDDAINNKDMKHRLELYKQQLFLLEEKRKLLGWVLLEEGC